MKVKCEFCGNMISDTLDKCPNCGAPSAGVKRTADQQPHTIEELKKWYADRGLPPAEITRFFIGQNYNAPRAFGIYKDPVTGNYVVYKNKDNGQRAVRYEGTDEAYAVNELYMRLKQEIIQQKANQANKRVSSNLNRTMGNYAMPPRRRGSGVTRGIFRLLMLGGALFLGMIALIMAIGTAVLFSEPKEGYFLYEDQLYYHTHSDLSGRSWFLYEDDKQDWSAPIADEDIPEPFEKKSTSKKYFEGEDWKDTFGGKDFKNSVSFEDTVKGQWIQTGYYQILDEVFYHQYSSYDMGWYVYEEDWKTYYFDDLPEEFKHTSLVENYFISDQYSDQILVSNFEESLCYKDSVADQDIEKGYYKTEDDLFYHLAPMYDTGWYYYDNTEWVSIGSDELPDDLKHASYVEDFYYTPTWEESQEFTDFLSTDLYEEDKDLWSDDDSSSSSSTSDSDSSFDWGSSSSWDSGSSDWGSDW